MSFPELQEHQDFIDQNKDLKIKGIYEFINMDMWNGSKNQRLDTFQKIKTFFLKLSYSQLAHKNGDLKELP